MTSHQKQHPYGTIASESQDAKLPSSVFGGTGRQSRADASKCSSNGSASETGAGPCSEPEETDYLLPLKLYGTSRSSGPAKTKDSGCPSVPVETVCSLVLQILVPFLLAGLGTVSAGILLELFQNWDVFLEVTEIFILVPAVLGMKGNLEMTLASRLSTAVNSGKMESPKEKRMLIVCNLALKQLQATVLGLLASVMATLLGWMAEGRMPLHHVAILCSASLSTAFVSSLLQGVLMVAVILFCKWMKINPDNVATPMAASLGDLVTLALLAFFGQWAYAIQDSNPFVLYLVDLFIVCLIPLWVFISSKHPASQILLRTGWEPIITAMFISSIGGLILDKTISDPNLEGLIVFAPVINGIGGNLVSIQASRISTSLHLNCLPGQVPEDRRRCFNPCRTFFGSGPNHRSAQVLLLLVIPGQLIFLFAIHLMKGGNTLPSALLTIAFLSASLIQVLTLLCMADCMVHCLWRRGKDPDSYSIPYLTALGDLLGTGLLSLAFLILWWINKSGHL